MVRLSLKSAFLAFTALSLPAAAWAQDAAPATAAAPAKVAPPPIAAFGQLPAIEMASLSADGSRTAIARTVNGKREIVVLDEADRVLVRAGLADQKLIRLFWAGNDYLIVYLRQTIQKIDGNRPREISHFAVLNTKTGENYFIFEGHDNASVSSPDFYGIRQIDGVWRAFFNAKIRNVNPHLVSVNLADGKWDIISPGFDYDETRSWIIDEKGNRAVTIAYQADDKWVIRNGEQKAILRGKDGRDDSTYLVGLSADGSQVLYAQFDANLDAYVLKQASLTTGAVTVPTDLPSNPDFLIFDPMTERVIGYQTDKVGDLPVFFNAQHNVTIKALQKTFPGKLVRVMSYSSDKSMIVFRTEGAGDSGTWYQMDMANRNAWPIGFERPEIAANQVGEIRVIQYTAADGLAMEMIVTLPPGLEPKNLPVIMFPHGGPHAHDEPRWDYWAQAMASRGYIVVQPNFRGSTNKGRPFETAGYGEWGGKMQTDVSDALAHLAGIGMIDPKRACIVGASYGGYVALAGVTVQQGLYQCAVSVAGVSDLPQMIKDDVEVSGFSPSTKRYYRKAIGEGRDLKLVSPVFLAARADAPILLIHGKDDSVVFINQSDKMAKELSKAGKPFEYIKLDGEDHWLSRGDTRTAMLEATIAFVEKHNPPGPQ